MIILHFAFTLGRKANVYQGGGAMPKVVVTEEDGERAAKKTQWGKLTICYAEIFLHRSG